MSNLIKDKHTLILKTDDRKKIIVFIDFIVYDVGVNIQCTAERDYSIEFTIRGVDIHFGDLSVKNFSTEMGRDVWKTLVKQFKFEHHCKSHCDSN